MCYVTNERMSLEKWSQLKFDAMTISWRDGERNLEPFNLNNREFYMFMPVIYCKYSPHVIFFYQCEYCGKHILDENDCCKFCSAPVEM